MDTLNKQAKLKGKVEIDETMMAGSSSEVQNKNRLNPFAKEWDPTKDRAPEETRCLYLAFSRWHALNEDEITLFFTQRFGRCIEKLNFQRPQKNEDALIFGKVVFHFSTIPTSILGKENHIMLAVNSKSLWCLRFDPLNQNNEV
ncbi:hypothetical protein K1719_039549 [Acacia pycnantha]|nr:hypothetical protein K1719_039549 [Acacia pycnantha]